MWKESFLKTQGLAALDFTDIKQGLVPKSTLFDEYHVGRYIYDSGVDKSDILSFLTQVLERW